MFVAFTSLEHIIDDVDGISETLDTGGENVARFWGCRVGCG
jgi:hypothetical protein